MMRVLLALFRDDAGNAMVEYAIIAASIALPLIGIAFAISQSAGTGLSQTTSSLSQLGTNPP